MCMHVGVLFTLHNPFLEPQFLFGDKPVEFPKRDSCPARVKPFCLRIYVP